MLTETIFFFKFAVGKPMTSDIYRWNVFRSLSVLGLISQPKVVLATLYSNESIAKLVVRLDENHPFNI